VLAELGNATEHQAPFGTARFPDTGITRVQKSRPTGHSREEL